MNRFLIAAFNLHLQKTNQPLHALFLLDRGLGISGDECRRCLGPWESWLVVRDVHLIDGEVGDDLFATLKPCPFHFVVGVSDRVEILDAIRTRCESLSLNYIDSTYPPPTGSNESLVQEVAHHDFEIGGRNEFDGAPVRHSTAILNQLSSTHCRRVFPMYVWSDLLALRAAANSRKLRTLDIGCGPISRLRWGAIQECLEIFGVDPLLDMYSVVLERHGLSGLPYIKCQHEFNMMAEDLPALPLANCFDFIYSNNALDHCQDPPRIIELADRLLSRDGLFVIQVATREGSRQNWEQLHKYDFYLDKNRRLVCETQDGTVTQLLSEGSGLRIRRVLQYSETGLALLLSRGPE